MPVVPSNPPTNPNPPQRADGKFELRKEKSPDNESRSILFTYQTEDVIAAFAGFVALIVAIGMILGWIPVNAWTVGVLGFSGVGGVISKIIAARGKRHTDD